jgi:hypothetical protein
VTETSRELYCSANGDRWLLMRDQTRDGVFIRHLPNAPSGGKIQDMDVGDFLSRGPQGPEHQHLLTLIGTLVSDADEEPGRSVA